MGDNMERWPRIDAPGRLADAYEHIAALRAEAADERLLLAARPASPATGMRVRLGRWFLRIGAMLAAEGELVRSAGDRARMDRQYP
jgi:hypothetical protein